MDNQKSEKYLPIGTVVLLKNGVKRVMINGYLTISDENKKKIYDYSGVLYPEGILKTNHNLLFNHEQIIKIYHLGLIDQEQKNYNDKLKALNINNE